MIFGHGWGKLSGFGPAGDKAARIAVEEVIDPAVESELGVEVRGDYRNAFDRNITFSLAQPGIVGDPNQTRLELTVKESKKVAIRVE